MEKVPTPVLFIDRDGTLIKEAPPTYQLDSFGKLEFYPEVFKYMRAIASEFDYELVMVTNQDGLGTPAFPEDTFWPVQNFVMQAFANEAVHFKDVFIDKTFPHEHAGTRKPATGMLTKYLDGSVYDMQNSFVIGDRITDMQLAANMGCKGLWLCNDPALGAAEIDGDMARLQQQTIVLTTPNWLDVYELLAGKKNG